MRVSEVFLAGGTWSPSSRLQWYLFLDTRSKLAADCSESSLSELDKHTSS